MTPNQETQRLAEVIHRLNAAEGPRLNISGITQGLSFLRGELSGMHIVSAFFTVSTLSLLCLLGHRSFPGELAPSETLPPSSLTTHTW